MKRLLALLLLLPLAAVAQELSLPGSTSQPLLPPGCASVTSGSSTAYGCSGPPALPPSHPGTAGGQFGPASQNTPAPQLGLYNNAATREQFGNQFGRSVQPQRPPAAFYPGLTAPPH